MRYPTVVEWMIVFCVFALATSWLIGCAPTPNKLAPEPPYAWQWHGGMDRARYLRDEEPLE